MYLIFLATIPCEFITFNHKNKSIIFLIFPNFTDYYSDSRFPIPDSRFPIPDSRFPIPDSRFPIPDSRLPIA
ncbi:MAG: hypothetical protein F6J90_08185 [Moorea sp. SIOASIH]|uniref:hypothetical protein n=1 Tax=Moorena sp. SIOASIH TaxID=2607817 RepID=UPI0013BC0E28|nr:hypothetical protein [Moorena sp. SIOASIH]NEO36299.1 hypothetical protein [Moorena sp. SIOASIH]